MTVDGEDASNGGLPPLQDVQALFDVLIDRVTDLKSSGNSDCSAVLMQSDLLRLKSAHRRVHDKLEGAVQSFSQKRELQIKQQRRLAALRYERQFLQHKIQSCRDYATPHLIELAKEENSKDEEGQDEEDDDQILKEYLNADLMDPTKRQHILTSLHHELNARGGLERDLKSAKQALAKTSDLYKEKKQFLDNLPDQLAAVERASLPLQKFMSAVPSKGSSSTPFRSGSERRNRIDTAQSLPPPLYTMYHQLQNYADGCHVAEESIGLSLTPSATTASGNRSGKTVEPGAPEYDESMQVLLQLSVPDVVPSLSSSSSKSTRGKEKRVTVHFHFNPSQNVVTAVAGGCGTTLNQDVLLSNLFPNDNPDPVEATVGRPFHWCNYLAGIHLVPSEQRIQTSVPPIAPSRWNRSSSTRVIVCQLHRRVRANAILKHVLYSLQRSHVPIVPPGAAEGVIDTKDLELDTGCKLVAFECLKDAGSNEKPQSNELNRAFHVTLKKAASMQTILQVDIDMAQYPAVPPVWTLQRQNQRQSTRSRERATPAGDDSCSEPPLFDERMAAIENLVNVALLEQVCESSPNQNEAFEWILVLQLRLIFMAVTSDSLRTPSSLLRSSRKRRREGES